MKYKIVAVSIFFFMVSIMWAAVGNLGQGMAVNTKNFSYQYNKSQWYLSFVGVDRLWEKTNQKKAAAQVIVAVVDSGIDAKHPDLKGKILKDLGYNFLDNSRNTMDELGHGTQLAGIIAAGGKTRSGVLGVAGNYNVKIIPVKVLDKNGKGRSDVVAKGIIYSVDEGADIINVSIDFTTHDSEITKALDYATEHGVMVVVASGNSNSNCDKYSPAGDSGAFTVASVNNKFKRSVFSSFGTSIQVAAPGEDIYTTTLDGKYAMTDGTSMAAPIVTGIAALIKLQRPDLDGVAIQRIITMTATDVMSKGWDKYTGYGVVNAYNALRLTATYDLAYNGTASTSMFTTKKMVNTKAIDFYTKP